MHGSDCPKALSAVFNGGEQSQDIYDSGGHLRSVGLLLHQSSVLLRGLVVVVENQRGVRLFERKLAEIHLRRVFVIHSVGCVLPLDQQDRVVRNRDVVVELEFVNPEVAPFIVPRYLVPGVSEVGVVNADQRDNRHLVHHSVRKQTIRVVAILLPHD